MFSKTFKSDKIIEWMQNPFVDKLQESIILYKSNKEKIYTSFLNKAWF